MIRKILAVTPLLCTLLAGTPALAGGCVQSYFFNKEPYLNPAIVRDLTDWVSDSGDQVVTINITDSQQSNRYFADSTRVNGALVSYKTPEGGTYGYQWLGQIAPFVDVVKIVDQSGGGSGVFQSVLFLRYACDKGLQSDGKQLTMSRERFLVTKLGEFTLGDKWEGTLEVKPGAVVVNGTSLPFKSD